MSGLTFLGYPRADGWFGIRNHLLILSSTVYANAVTERIASAVRGTVALTHPLGRGQIGPDRDLTVRTLVEHAKHPNVGAVVIVDHFMEEQGSAEDLAEVAAAAGVPVEALNIRDAGGAIAATAKGTRAAVALGRKISGMQRTEAPVSELFLGLNCGTSDTTSGPSSNRALGVASDRLIAQGGRSVLAELTELMGAEDILRGQANSPEVGEAMVNAIAAMEQRALTEGVDIRGAQPTADNMIGGLSTIEEKSLGGVLKAGRSPFVGVLNYSERPSRDPGVYLMCTPGHGAESITGIAGGGAQIMVFSTGGGHTIGHPLMPTIKVTGNSQSYAAMSDVVDLDVSQVLTGELSLEDAGSAIYQEIIAVASGRLTLSELLKEETGFAIHRVGMSL